MDTQAIYDQINRNAARLRILHADMHAKHRLRDKGPEAVAAWHNAAKTFRDEANLLAFPGGYQGALDRVLGGDPHTMEAALCFLELRPFYFRSGYMFKDLLRKSRKAPLTEAQKARLRVVEAAVADWRAKKLAQRQAAAQSAEHVTSGENS